MGTGASDRPARWEFVGIIAEAAARDRYINGYLGDLFSQGAQNPISYVNLRSCSHCVHEINLPCAADIGCQ